MYYFQIFWGVNPFFFFVFLFVFFFFQSFWFFNPNRYYITLFYDGLNVVDNIDTFVNVGNQHTTKTLRMKQAISEFPKPLFQNEGRCSAFDMEIIFHSHANKTHFHKKGCAPSLILKVTVSGTRKWPIIMEENQIFTRVQKFSSLRTTLAEEDIASCSRAFRKPKNAEEERKLIENGTPKSARSLKKYSLKKVFKWPNGR